MSSKTITTCDRCGEEIRYVGWIAIIKGLKKKRLKRIRFRYIYNGNHDGCSYSDQELDLCSNCTCALEKFLEKEEQIKMTLELLRYKDDFFEANRDPKPYKLGGVEKITCNTEYGIGHFAITIFDTRIFAMDRFQYVKNAKTGEYYVKNGVWVCMKDVIDD